jgi:hypothetical protein
VTPAKARKLLGLGQPARFGRGEDTVTDPEVRDTWEIPKHLVRAQWNDATLKDILATVKEELGLPNAAELPVTHQTSRQGRPYTLVLNKTDALFAREQEAQTGDETDLEWLAAQWDLRA